MGTMQNQLRRAYFVLLTYSSTGLVQGIVFDDQTPWASEAYVDLSH